MFSVFFFLQIIHTLQYLKSKWRFCYFLIFSEARYFLTSGEAGWEGCTQCDSKTLCALGDQMHPNSVVSVIPMQVKL